MAYVSVIGAGSWGTAIAKLLCTNGHKVTLWSYREEEVRSLIEKRENLSKLPGVKLPEEIIFTADLEAAVRDKEMCVMAVPSTAVRSTAKKMAPYAKPGQIVVNLAKGIEESTLMILTDIIEQEIPGVQATVLSGPSHAEEVGREIPTTAVAGAKKKETAEFMQNIFMNQRFRVYTSDDKIGTEICAALKNIIALCAGCCDGMGCGDNTKALLMTRGLAEMARLGVALGGRKDSFTGLAGVGDLIVTCCSMHSRNRRCGILIGQGKPVDEAVKEIGAVVEGYYAANNARALAQKAGVEMPIAQAAYEVLYEGRDVHAVITDLMQRAKRSERDESYL